MCVPLLALIPAAAGIAGSAAGVATGGLTLASGLALGASALGGAAAVGGEIAKANASAEEGEFAAKQAERNAAIAKAAALDAERRGEAATGKVREQVGQAIGAQRQVASQSGVQLNTGTAARLQEATRAAGEQDVLTTRDNARREAWSLRTQAQDILKQGKYAREAGFARQAGGYLAAGGTLLGGGANLYGEYRKYKYEKKE